MASPLRPALRALPLSVVDFVAAAALYEFVSPVAGVLLGVLGALVLGVVLVRLYHVASRDVPARH
ncbi:hypothetical protein BV210_08450 [Halorientalis sp. IM1011]|uniref:hypothetical protein n=1 Tax=Halorientalis sp. IM1011 TaxID=1932360 RepID=UPI00097CC612|nr:hypothetical protein [Halorientalis sp. IM1011]AQL42738.1 hypothetical protein BV210_08450 [Halorientalis sp. IM1011]